MGSFDGWRRHCRRLFPKRCVPRSPSVPDWRRPLESFSLLDLEGFGLEEAFPQAYSIAHDGYGNYWVLDLLPGDGAWGPVFYACHDPAVIGYQAETIETFLADVVAMWRPGRSPVDRMHERRSIASGASIPAS